VNRNVDDERRAYRLARRALLLRAHLRIPAAWYDYRPLPVPGGQEVAYKKRKNVLSRCKKISLALPHRKSYWNRRTANSKTLLEPSRQEVLFFCLIAATLIYA